MAGSRSTGTSRRARRSTGFCSGRAKARRRDVCSAQAGRALETPVWNEENIERETSHFEHNKGDMKGGQGEGRKK